MSMSGGGDTSDERTGGRTAMGRGEVRLPLDFPLEVSRDAIYLARHTQNRMRRVHEPTNTRNATYVGPFTGPHLLPLLHAALRTWCNRISPSSSVKGRLPRSDVRLSWRAYVMASVSRIRTGEDATNASGSKLNGGISSTRMMSRMEFRLVLHRESSQRVSCREVVQRCKCWGKKNTPLLCQSLMKRDRGHVLEWVFYEPTITSLGVNRPLRQKQLTEQPVVRPGSTGIQEDGRPKLRQE